MGSMIVSVRRRVPKRIRAGALRLLGRRPVEAPERVVELALPRAAGAEARSITIRTPARNYITRVLAESGLAGYEADTLACFVAAIEETGSGPAFDVGANIGVFSWLGAALTSATVVAFEPTPDLADQMRAICSDNDLAVVVEAIALGAAPGTATLYLSDKTDSSNSLRAGFRKSHGSVVVPVETLDGYAARTGIAPGVIKVDTESTEPDVLRGASRLLATSRPWIICEVLAGRTEAELTALFEPHGYWWYRIDGPGPLERLQVIEGDQSYKYLNWLFAPTEPSPAYWQRVAAWRAAIAATATSD